MTQLIINGILLDEQQQLTLADLSHACARHVEWVVELVEEGIIEPQGNDPDDWRFSPTSFSRAYKAMRLQRDLELNIAGVGLVLDLMDQLDTLQARLHQFERMP
jgi:chaperone modulatory protein CbpM